MTLVRLIYYRFLLNIYRRYTVLFNTNIKYQSVGQSYCS